MMVSWNVRGINKVARNKEVSSYLHSFNVPIVALLETRVKMHNAKKVRNKIGGSVILAIRKSSRELKIYVTQFLITRQIKE